MYIIIKRDKAEHLKEKMHHIKAAAMEVLDCIEEAASTRHDGYREETRRHEEHPYYHNEPMYPHDYEDREMARRGRMRY